MAMYTKNKSKQKQTKNPKHEVLQSTLKNWTKRKQTIPFKIVLWDNPRLPFSSCHLILSHTSGGISYATRSQTSILNPRSPQARLVATYIARISVPNLDSNHLLDQRSFRPSEVHRPTWVETRPNHKPWQSEDQRGLRNQGRKHSFNKDKCRIWCLNL